MQPPNTPQYGERSRLIVRARDELPKAFIWEIIMQPIEGQPRRVVRSSWPTVFKTMEAAYEAGRRAQQEKR